MKKMTAFLLIICMIIPTMVFATETEEKTEIYIFGDDWAKMWGNELESSVSENIGVFNCATEGDLLSQIAMKPEYNLVSKNDVVIISYGILEKDRKGDTNSEFKKNLENTVSFFTKKGATVIFASVCSTMRYNTLTNQMEETRNFYTETTRAFARANNITYVDLSKATAQWANYLGSERVKLIYASNMALTSLGNRMCANEVYNALCNIDNLKGNIKGSLSIVYHVPVGIYSHSFDTFYLKDKCESFALYVKDGVNVKVNSNPVPDGDSVVMCESVNGRVDVTFTSARSLQLAPVYKFNASGTSCNDETPFIGKVRPGVYDVIVKKNEALKASVYLNGYMVASNLDMPGTEKVTEASEHTFTDYHMWEDSFKVTIEGLTDKLEYIYFRESSIIYEEKPKVFLAGDSTVCNYYPLVRTGEELDGTVMTGWGMLLDKYVDAEVINLAASGYWAKKWLDTSFDIVEKEGRKGDLFVVQFGINDLYYSTLDEMKVSLNEMIDRCVKKGMIPVLVSPQISAGYGWGDESNVGKSDGGDYEEFFNAVRELSKERGCFYVDLTDLSSGWFSEVGREGVYKKYHLWNYEKNEPGDMMHLSYKGADAMCRFFVLGLKKISEAKQTDNWGNSLEMLKIW